MFTKEELQRYDDALSDFLCWREGYRAGVGDGEDYTAVIDVEGLRQLKRKLRKISDDT